MNCQRRTTRATTQVITRSVGHWPQTKIIVLAPGVVSDCRDEDDSSDKFDGSDDDGREVLVHATIQNGKYKNYLKN